MDVKKWKDIDRDHLKWRKKKTGDFPW
jgi:hypothetical protein